MAERETPGQRIRNLREAAFITQKDFAERIGVAPSQLSRIESGETKTISSDTVSYTHLDVYKRQASDPGSYR